MSLYLSIRSFCHVVSVFGFACFRLGSNFSEKGIAMTDAAMGGVEDAGFEASYDDKKTVESHVKRLTEFVKQIPLEDFKNGNWFLKLLTVSLQVYAKKVDAEYFRTKYPSLPVDAVVQARIDLASKYAGIEGFLTAGAYSGAVVATLGTAAGASPVTVPAAITTFGVDLTYTTMLQLQLVYDISILYGVPFDLDDPDDLMKFVKIAFGIEVGESARLLTTKAMPGVVSQVVKKFYSKGVLTAAKSLPVVGKYLLQRSVVKFSIPLVSVPVATGVNYWSTKLAGDHTRQMLRSEARIREIVPKLLENSDHEVLIWVVWLVITADEQTQVSERQLLNELTLQLAEDLEAEELLARFSKAIEIDTDEILHMLDALESGGEQIYRAALMTAAVSGEVTTSEKSVLKQIALHSGVVYDEDEVMTAARQWESKTKRRLHLPSFKRRKSSKKVESERVSELE